jgi:endonuclease YncB( thermonuclease family)
MGNFWTKQQLKGRTKDNTKAYGFGGQEMIGKVVSVYDGDTFTAIVKINGLFQKIKVRCYGYDSPELKPSKKDANRDKQIECAQVAKAFLENMIFDKIVTLNIHGFDKYGRFLATVYIRHGCDTFNVNAAMLSGGYGVPYDGGKKQLFE